ncbi:Fibrous sheath-interacting protein 2 [Frankliniella fusca]|uniref:Fibrous sheath-interacting protein 2 n=1 Tax=Frankliniella fusca TaxID=407009 RepID=A0AAE1I1P8_9NEOP|nr:Fibrous sheath-interacting protein 2 [Frankliniella fusca]
MTRSVDDPQRHSMVYPLYTYGPNEQIHPVGAEMLSVSELRRRTNNDAESWNAYLKSKAGGIHLNCWEFINVLKQIEVRDANDFHRAKFRGKVPRRKQNLVNRRTDAAIREAMKTLKEPPQDTEDLRRFLRAVAHQAASSILPGTVAEPDERELEERDEDDVLWAEQLLEMENQGPQDQQPPPHQPPPRQTQSTLLQFFQATTATTSSSQGSQALITYQASSTTGSHGSQVLNGDQATTTTGSQERQASQAFIGDQATSTPAGQESQASNAHQARSQGSKLGRRGKASKIPARHRRSADVQVRNVANGVWKAVSYTKGVSYTVRRVAPFCCCEVRCYACGNLCGRMFTCSCPDSHTLCKHVHAVFAAQPKGAASSHHQQQQEQQPKMKACGRLRLSRTSNMTWIHNKCWTWT